MNGASSLFNVIKKMLKGKINQAGPVIVITAQDNPLNALLAAGVVQSRSRREKNTCQLAIEQLEGQFSKVEKELKGLEELMKLSRWLHMLSAWTGESDNALPEEI